MWKLVCVILHIGKIMAVDNIVSTFVSLEISMSYILYARRVWVKYIIQRQPVRFRGLIVHTNNQILNYNFLSCDSCSHLQ